MKRLLPLSLVLLFCCSKQENANTENTQTPVQSSVAPQGKALVELSPEEIEDIAWSILLKFHDDNLMQDADLMAHMEELSVEGDHILYRLLRHNGSEAGWHSDQEVDENPPFAEDWVEETEEERAAREAAESIDEEQAAADAAYTERYGLRNPPEEEITPFWSYKNTIDTLSYDGSYAAYLESGSPEAAIKTVRIVFTGRMEHKNAPINQGVEEPYDTIQTTVTSSNVGDIIVEVGKPVVIDRSQLYLRARIAKLTDQDLAGLSKEDMGLLRNEIFARHGHTFKTNKMWLYFNGKRWYAPRVDDATTLLNKFEKRNVEFIRKKEG